MFGTGVTAKTSGIPFTDRHIQTILKASQCYFSTCRPSYDEGKAYHKRADIGLRVLFSQDLSYSYPPLFSNPALN